MSIDEVPYVRVCVQGEGTGWRVRSRHLELVRGAMGALWVV